MADYKNLLPPPLATDERFRALASILDDWSGLDADLVRTLGHIAQADSLQLQHFAEWFSLSDEPAWSYAESIDARRSLAAAAVLLHRRKGTPWAVKRVLELIGMGSGTRVIEGGIQRHYDGTVSADGSRCYSGAAWAEYSIEADLGETAGLNTGTGSRIRQVLSGIAPARCHLNDITWRANMSDSVTVSERQAVNVESVFSDIISKPRYDGAWRHDAADALSHDGGARANGSDSYQGWRLKANPNRYGPEESILHSDVNAAFEDTVGFFQTYNGARRADGSLDYGASAVCCADEPMVIRKTTLIRHNGTKRYSGQVTATGDITTFLEAA